MPRLLPSEATDPWPTFNVVYALLLIHLPIGTCLVVRSRVRRRSLAERLGWHLGAAVILAGLLLSGVLV